ncbi:MAG: hypothetical protein KDI46_02720 [Alphaproteobacteria bacterium]|nr:hypothetical protein [Alphaproteobacteria bacterium]
MGVIIQYPDIFQRAARRLEKQLGCPPSGIAIIAAVEASKPHLGFKKQRIDSGVGHTPETFSRISREELSDLSQIDLEKLLSVVEKIKSGAVDVHSEPQGDVDGPR